METIYAPATARGRAGICVVRISGPAAAGAATALCGSLPPPRRAALRRLRCGTDVLDEALVIVFEAGASFTGETVVEFHLHGSLAVLNAVLGALGRHPGLRLAAPGEFTRRAMENGRLDLAQVEGLADLLMAETEAQRRQAQRVLSGAIGRRADGWRQRLVRAAALLEATIDFSEEELPPDTLTEAASLVAAVRAEIGRELAGAEAAERVRDGYEVAILGRPNIGKSTLLNALAGRDAALVSSVAGTTRDVIEVRMDIAGLAVTLLDTAGLRETEDPVERMGVDRARRRAEAADLRVFLVEPGEDARDPALRPQDIIMIGKGDLHPGHEDAVSGLTGSGVRELLERIGATLAARAASAGTVTRARHRAALTACAAALDLVAAETRAAQRPEILAEDLRRALRSLDALVGRVDVEHILDEVFGSFCIGK